VLVMSFPFSVLKTLGKVLRAAFVEFSHDPIDDINTMSDLCVYSRKNGLLALEKYSENFEDCEGTIYIAKPPGHPGPPTPIQHIRSARPNTLHLQSHMPLNIHCHSLVCLQ
jgi:hypothetical protein